MESPTKRLLVDWIPPALLRSGRAAVARMRPPPFEAVGTTWPGASPASEGWNAEGVAAARERQWNALKSFLAGTEVFGVSREEIGRPWHPDLGPQSLYLTFGYALGRAAAGRLPSGGHGSPREAAPVRVLDWGGEIGSYHEVAKALLPEVRFDWHCAELPAVAALGQRLNPGVTFHGDEGWAGEPYDFVFSSSSLQYLPDWRPTVRRLVACARGPILFTRLPFVQRAASFVALQRVPEYGTAYHGWVFNRDEFVATVESAGAHLERAFLNHAGPRIEGATEQNAYMGFLFRPNIPSPSAAVLTDESVS